VKKRSASQSLEDQYAKISRKYRHGSTPAAAKVIQVALLGSFQNVIRAIKLP